LFSCPDRIGKNNMKEVFLMRRRDAIKQLSLAALSLPVGLNAGAIPQQRKAHLRTSICAYSFRNELAKKTMRYEDLVRLAADLGVDGLDLTVYWFPSTTDDFLLPLRLLAYRSGIDIQSIGIRTNMCRATPELQDAEVTALKPWLDVAEKLGARHIRVFGGSPPKGTADDQAVPWAVATLKKCAALAASRGMILGVEDDGAFTTNAERLVEIVKQVNSPWVGINLDTGNFPTDGYRQVEMCLPYAVHMHVKSNISEQGRRQPTDWDRLFQMVAPVYRGYMSLEYEGNDDPRKAVPELIGILQTTLRKFAPCS
jgi:sugar phosphate isomerase/epimerase